MNQKTKLFILANQNFNADFTLIYKNTHHENVKSGFKPLSQVLGSQIPLEGLSPFWMISTDKVSSLGLVYKNIKNGSFVNTRTAYISCHFLDTNRQEFLKNTLGKPTGEEMQHMLSSPRTVLVSGLSETPFILKFSGQEIPEISRYAGRTMDLHRLTTTTQLNQYLDKNMFFDESEGFSLNLQNSEWSNLTVLKRNISSLADTTEKTLVLPLFFYFSDMSEKLKGLIFEDFKLDKKDWLETQLVPKISDLIWQAFEKTGLHPEIHQQNLNVVTENGRVSQVLCQDTCDLLEDYLYQLTCLPHLSFAGFRRSKYPLSCSEYSNTQHSFNSFLSHWYKFFLDDFGLYEESINYRFLKKSATDNDFIELLKLDLLKRMWKEISNLNIFSKYDKLVEFEILNNPRSDLFMILNAFRDLKIKLSIATDLHQMEPISLEKVQKMIQQNSNSIQLNTFGADTKKFMTQNTLNSQFYQKNLPQHKTTVLAKLDLETYSHFDIIGLVDQPEWPKYTH